MGGRFEMVEERGTYDELPKKGWAPGPETETSMTFYSRTLMQGWVLKYTVPKKDAKRDLKGIGKDYIRFLKATPQPIAPEKKATITRVEPPPRAKEKKEDIRGKRMRFPYEFTGKLVSMRIEGEEGMEKVKGYVTRLYGKGPKRKRKNDEVIIIPLEFEGKKKKYIFLIDKRLLMKEKKGSSAIRREYVLNVGDLANIFTKKLYGIPGFRDAGGGLQGRVGRYFYRWINETRDYYQEEKLAKKSGFELETFEFWVGGVTSSIKIRLPMELSYEKGKKKLKFDITLLIARKYMRDGVRKELAKILKKDPTEVGILYSRIQENKSKIKLRWLYDQMYSDLVKELKEFKLPKSYIETDLKKAVEAIDRKKLMEILIKFTKPKGARPT